MAHLLVFLLVAEVSIRGIHYSTFPLLFVIVMEALGRMITRAVSGGYLKFPLTIWVASRQEPCSSIGWHLLVFSIETSKVQIPPPPTIELSKNLRGESFLFSLWMIHSSSLWVGWWYTEWEATWIQVAEMSSSNAGGRSQ